MLNHGKSFKRNHAKPFELIASIIASVQSYESWLQCGTEERQAPGKSVYIKTLLKALGFAAGAK